MDIVEWLRWNAKEQGSRFEEAAKEIERLRNDKKDLLTQTQMLRQSMDWCKSLIFGIEQKLTIND